MKRKITRSLFLSVIVLCALPLVYSAPENNTATVDYDLSGYWQAENVPMENTIRLDIYCQGEGKIFFDGKEQAIVVRQHFKLLLRQNFWESPRIPVFLTDMQDVKFTVSGYSEIVFLVGERVAKFTGNIKGQYMFKDNAFEFLKFHAAAEYGRLELDQTICFESLDSIKVQGNGEFSINVYNPKDNRKEILQ